ncbi:MAG TPA: YihY/virulence factor BrkB family protein [Bryobacteraceae bacterium]|jgi:membrane protein|nr:YihY/virulence factor BrkB family protein [Bryobacteraceae bacterium]
MPALSTKQVFELVKTTALKWNAHNAPRLGAALAYYTLLSVAPLLVLIVAICGLVLEKSAAEHQLLAQVQQMAGNSAAKSLQTVLAHTHHVAKGILAGLIALITLLFGASGVFSELRDSLNTIWDAPPSHSATWRSVIWRKIVSFGMVLALGFLLLASLLLSATLAVVTKFFEGYLPVRTALWGEAANIVLPLVAMSVLFALIFKFVPDVKISWRDVAIGSVATAILFEIGKGLLAIYLGTAGVGSTYGAAGSLVAFIVWVYYSAQIFFFGAIFTQVYSETVGSHRRLNGQKALQPVAPLPPATRSVSA